MARVDRQIARDGARRRHRLPRARRAVQGAARPPDGAARRASHAALQPRRSRGEGADACGRQLSPALQSPDRRA